MIFDALCVFVKDFYIHLGIIAKLVDQLTKKSSDKDIKDLYDKHVRYWKKINIIRNNIIIHKEKNNFIIPRFKTQATDPSGISIELKYLSEEGIKETIEMIPIDDLCIAKKFLEKLKNILETKKV